MKTRIALPLLLLSLAAAAPARLTLEQKAAQTIIHVVPPVFLNRGSDYHRYLRRLIAEVGIGGIHVWSGPAYETALLIRKCRAWARRPLLVGADLERGAGAIVRQEKYFGPNSEAHLPEYIGGGGVHFPPLMALGAAGSAELAYQMGLATAREARAVGIDIAWAPVLDVNSNPDNPIVNTRSFGEDARQVAELGAAFIRGCRAGGLAATAKHFPGHGDVAVDSHLALPVLNAGLERLSAVELRPFAAAIAAGVDAVMSAHIAVPPVSGDERPATLSPPLLEGLLRGRLGFRGLIVTDGMVMAGITARFTERQAAVAAIQAGADMLLYLADPEAAASALADAVRRGELPLRRLDEALARIQNLKRRLASARRPALAPALERLEAELDAPPTRALAARIAAAAVTLLANRQVLPLAAAGGWTLLRIADGYRPLDGQTFRDALAAASPPLAEYGLWPETAECAGARAAGAIPPGATVVCPLLVTYGAGKGRLAVPPAAIDLLAGLRARGCRLIYVNFGSPYVLSALPDGDAVVCAYYPTRELELAAAAVLLGRQKPAGRLPVTIPGKFARGAGQDGF